MRTEIVPGVYLSVVPTMKFKTTSITIHFLMPTVQADLSARTLLTSVLETSSAKYPKQTEIAAELERLYGASFGIGVARDGQLHRVSASMRIINDQLAETDLLSQSIAFLREVLFAPLQDENGDFVQDAVSREQENLVAYLSSMNEDRQTQANLGAVSLYFTDESQRSPHFGTADAMREVTLQDLKRAYSQMVNENQIEILVAGDVDAATIAPLIATFGLKGRAVTLPAIQYTQEVGEKKTQMVREPIKQAKLNLIYQAQAPLYGDEYYALIVTQELFGGSPLSLLFTNVREKASLAYYANTNYNAFRQFLLVQTGIEPAKRDEVEKEIEKQLVSLQQGDFSEELLQAIKDGLLNGRLSAEDSPRFLLRQAYLSALLPEREYGFDAYKRGIEKVDKAQVIAAAKKIIPQGSYFLTSEEDANGMD